MKASIYVRSIAFAVFVTFFSDAAQADLIAHWPLDDSGVDTAGGFDAAVPGGVTFVADGANEGTGGAASFTGGGGLKADYAPELNPVDAFTVSAWVNPTNTNSWNTVVSSRSHTGNTVNGFIIYNSPDNDWDFWTGAMAPSGQWGRNIGPKAELDSWTHLAITYDGSSDTKILWVDGENAAEVTGQGYNPNDQFPFNIGAGDDTGNNFFYTGLIDDVRLYDEPLEQADIQAVMLGMPTPPLVLNGSGETYLQNFDDLGVDGRRMPKGWNGVDTDGSSRGIDSLGLVDGPLEGAVESAAGIVNVGGNAERFSTPADGRVGTWQDDLDNSGALDAADVVADAATDRALGNGRVNPDDAGSLSFEIEIADNPVRAMTFTWDLEVWGGDPESAFRGTEGGGYIADLSVGGTSYYNETASLVPGDLFDTSFDSSPGANHDPTLINGNEHAVRGNSSGIVEVTAADGAVGNLVQLSFNADHGGDDGGWISAVDNVQLRALAAGDAQADGDVDPADLIQFLAGGAFGQGNIDATWGQGDFDNDGDFDGTDILAVVQGLAGEFPKTYAHDPSNGVPDVLINPATGNITLDTNGTTIGSIVMDSVAGIFNGPNSPSWDAPGDFAADIDTQISMPISFTNPGYTGVDDLGDGIIGDLAPGFDILADLTIKYLDPNGDLLDAEAHVVPEPSSIVLATFGVLGMLGYFWRRRRLS